MPPPSQETASYRLNAGLRKGPSLLQHQMPTDGREGSFTTEGVPVQGRSTSDVTPITDIRQTGQSDFDLNPASV